LSNLLCLHTQDLGADYKKLLSDVMRQGDVVRPRGMEVREVRPLLLTLSRPERCFTKRPGINRALTYMEICQILAGEFDGALFEAVSPLASKLLTAGGAYGPRTAGQIRLVVAELQKDPDSRRAVVYVGRDTDLERIHASSTTDQPCTATWQFFNRGGRLEMVVNMRSWDLVWGLANDVPCFVAVQQGIAWALGLEVGGYTHLAGSAHIYERHYDMADKVEAATTWLDPLVRPGLIPTEPEALSTDPIARWDTVVKDAGNALRTARKLLERPAEQANTAMQWAAPAGMWARRFAARDTKGPRDA
jgi:thymidylate synthase